LSIDAVVLQIQDMVEFGNCRKNARNAQILPKCEGKGPACELEVAGKQGGNPGQRCQ